MDKEEGASNSHNYRDMDEGRSDLMNDRSMQTEKLKHLLEEERQNVNYRDDSGNFALLEASKSGALDIVRLLLKKRAEVDMQSLNKESSSSSRENCMVKLLVDLQNDKGQSALMSSSLNRHCEVAKLLIEYGAGVDLQNNNGRSALML